VIKRPAPPAVERRDTARPADPGRGSDSGSAAKGDPNLDIRLSR